MRFKARPINGLVLTGGHSTRMGRDKGLLTYHGRPQRAHVFYLLRKYCAAVYTSCREEQGVPEILNPLYDAANTPGPLNGILTAFQARKTAWLIFAVDMPFVDEAAIESLIAHRDPSTFATCFRNRETRAPEPLLAIWEPQSYLLLTEFARGGGASPRKFLEMYPVTAIDPPDNRMLANINSPEETRNILLTLK